MGSFSMSNGERVSKSVIDRRVREAKKEKLEQQRDEYGYNFCTICGKNDCVPLDCSHIRSVKWCQENGFTELAWDLNNIEIIGRIHHQERDGLDLKWSKL